MRSFVKEKLKYRNIFKSTSIYFYLFFLLQVIPPRIARYHLEFKENFLKSIPRSFPAPCSVVLTAVIVMIFVLRNDKMMIINHVPLSHRVTTGLGTALKKCPSVLLLISGGHLLHIQGQHNFLCIHLYYMKV